MNLKRPHFIFLTVSVIVLSLCLIIAVCVHGWNTNASQQSASSAPVVSALSGTTFQVCDKTPEKVKISVVSQPRFVRHVKPSAVDLDGYGNLDLVTHLKSYEQNNCTHVIQGTDYSTEHIQPAGEHGFISTVISAYKDHHNLVIRPDDIWIAIMAQFALYIGANGEKFRKQFVEFDGKKRLVVKLNSDNLNTVSYVKFVELMGDQINANIIDKELRDWITPNFTTSTRDDKVAAGIILMATLKQFFEYVLNVACGIPNITLEGTEDDWKQLSTRLLKLKTYDLETWVDNMLQPIVNQFIAAKTGKVDENFWSNIVNVRSICGGPKITGWITAFSVFNADGKWQGVVGQGQSWPALNIRKLVPGVVYADVVICDHGLRHESVVFAGHIGQQIMQDGSTLKPRIGWAIALRNSTSNSSEVDGVKWEDLCEEIRNHARV